MTDATARNILEMLFHTWMVPAVRVSFYDAEELKAGALALLHLFLAVPSSFLPRRAWGGGMAERLELPGTPSLITPTEAPIPQPPWAYAFFPVSP